MEAASNNGIFPLLTANRVISHLPGSMVVLVPTPVMVFSPSNFNDHVQAQSVTMCGCRTARTAKPQTVITRPPRLIQNHVSCMPAPPSKSPLWASSCFTSSFWVTSIFEQYACFQMKFRSHLHVCWWIPELFSNHPVIQHVKNFQRKSWGLWKLCRYKENVRAVLCPAS